MKKLLLILTMSTFAFFAKAQQLTTFADSVSYLIGLNIGTNLSGAPFEYNLDLMKTGLEDAFAKKSMTFTEETINAVMERWQAGIQETQEKQAKAEADANKAKGAEFMAANAKVKGVKTTPSGLQYKVVNGGKKGGAKPLATDKVKVHYIGTLLDGTVFDSSVERGEPITFPLNGVIAGWTEGLQLMTPGAKYIFYIPSDLAYGDRTVSVIPAGSMLTFEVELLEINPADAE